MEETDVAKCRICSRVLKNNRLLLNHLNRNHGVLVKDVTTGRRRNRRLVARCEYCGRIFKSENILSAHISDSHEAGRSVHAIRNRNDKRKFNCIFCREVLFILRLNSKYVCLL